MKGSNLAMKNDNPWLDVITPRLIKFALEKKIQALRLFIGLHKLFLEAGGNFTLCLWFFLSKQRWSKPCQKPGQKPGRKSGQHQILA